MYVLFCGADTGGQYESWVFRGSWLLIQRIESECLHRFVEVSRKLFRTKQQKRSEYSEREQGHVGTDTQGP